MNWPIFFVYLVIAILIFLAMLFLAKKQTPNQITIVPKREALLVSIFLVFWIVPMAHRAALGKTLPVVSVQLKDWIPVARLFTKKAKHWPMFYIQVQFRKNGRWRNVDDALFFKMRPYGYENLIYRVLRRTGNKRRLNRRSREFAYWVGDKYAEMYPDRARPIALRFIRAGKPVTEEVPKKRWEKIPLNKLPRKWIREITYYDLKERP